MHCCPAPDLVSGLLHANILDIRSRRVHTRTILQCTSMKVLHKFPAAQYVALSSAKTAFWEQEVQAGPRIHGQDGVHVPELRRHHLRPVHDQHLHHAHQLPDIKHHPQLVTPCFHILPNPNPASCTCRSHAAPHQVLKCSSHSTEPACIPSCGVFESQAFAMCTLGVLPGNAVTAPADCQLPYPCEPLTALEQRPRPLLPEPRCPSCPPGRHAAARTCTALFPCLHALALARCCCHDLARCSEARPHPSHALEAPAHPPHSCFAWQGAGGRGHRPGLGLRLLVPACVWGSQMVQGPPCGHGGG